MCAGRWCDVCLYLDVSGHEVHNRGRARGLILRKQSAKGWEALKAFERGLVVCDNGRSRARRPARDSSESMKALGRGLEVNENGRSRAGSRRKRSVEAWEASEAGEGGPGREADGRKRTRRAAKVQPETIETPGRVRERKRSGRSMDGTARTTMDNKTTQTRRRRSTPWRAP